MLHLHRKECQVNRRQDRATNTSFNYVLNEWMTTMVVTVSHMNKSSFLLLLLPQRSKVSHTCLFSTYFLQSWCVCCLEMCNNITSFQDFYSCQFSFIFPRDPSVFFTPVCFVILCFIFIQLQLLFSSLLRNQTPFFWSKILTKSQFQWGSFVHPLCLVSLLAVCESQRSKNILFIHQFTDWKCASPVEMAVC